MSESKWATKRLYNETSSHVAQISTDEIFLNQVQSGMISRARTESPEIFKNVSAHRNEIINLALDVIKTMQPGMSTTEARVIAVEIANDALGVGPLFPLMQKSEPISNIKVFSWNNVSIEKNGDVISTRYKFRSEDHLRKTVERMAMLGGRRIDESLPKVSVRLLDGSRATIIIPPISQTGTALSIRRFVVSYTFDEMVKLGVFSKESGDVIKEAVKKGYSIIVIGPMGAGKTTLINALTGLILKTESIAILEDVTEIQSQHKNVFQFEARLPNIEGKGEITLSDLFNTVTLHIKPNWIILGESKGPEAYPVMVALNIGHSVISSYHAKNPQNAIFVRYPNMVMQTEEGRALGKENILTNLASGIDLILQMDQLPGGAYKCVEIAEVLEDDRGSILVPEINTIFKYEGGSLRKANGSRLFTEKARGYAQCS